MFIKEGTAFPPVEWTFWFNKYNEYAAWYSGEPIQLLTYYVNELTYAETEDTRFWARIEKSERAGIVHIPAAGDIAATSANLLFSESPRILYDEKANGADRIEDFIKENGMRSLLLEAAEISAAMSGAFLKIDIEPGLLKLPILSIIQPLQAIPTFWRGRLWEVLFFRTIKEDSAGVTWRLFENRKREGEALLIEYKLYRGTVTTVGREVDMASIEETANLNLADTRYNVTGLGCVYVPNKRPNRIVVGSALGENDFNGSITLLDSLDFAWTSWMRDIELGMGQVLIDEELLNKNTSTLVGDAATFSKFKKAFINLNLSKWSMSGGNTKPIEIVQFEMRVDEHMKTCKELFSNIVDQCGYSQQSFGLTATGDRAESGTALRIKERKSLLTREKKSRYWQPALREIFQQMQQFDVVSGLSKGYQPQDVDIELEDSIIIDPKDASETVRNLYQAEAISTYQRVKMIHPEWQEDDIEAEAQRILDEKGTIPDPFAL